VLDQVLAPHGLTILEGPAGQLIVVAAPAALTRPRAGVIIGKVTIGGRKPGERRVSVRVPGTRYSACAAQDGTFVLQEVLPGTYEVEVSTPGASPVSMRNVIVRSGQVSPLVVPLDQPSAFLNEIVVTPSHFRLIDTEPQTHTFLDGAELAQTPHAADDLLRAVKRLPGASGGDYSATFNIRGGDREELLILLDGVELYEPFHLKDFQSIFSIIDAEAAGGVDLLTGGFPAEYGDRMSGVMDITTATPSGPPRLTLAASTLNARVTSQGTFDDDRGRWLVDLRAWYPDDVATHVEDVANEIFSDYYDLLGKVEHTIGSRSVLSANVLVAYDDLGFTDQDEDGMETVAARYGSHQEWLNLRTDWSESLRSRTVLSGGQVRRRRHGGVLDAEDGTIDVHDHRDLDHLGLSQGWTLQLDDHHLVTWGLETRREWSHYDYDLRVRGATRPAAVADRRVETRVRGTSYGAYLSDRFRLGPSLVVETGLRWDRQSITGGQQVSPRVNIRYDLGSRTVLRAGWGRFFQSQRLNELQVEDGESVFHPAQLAEHTLLGVEHALHQDLAIRLELYSKRLTRLMPRFENLVDPLTLFPEASPDRVEILPERGRLQGLELLLSDDDGDTFDWWLSYTLSRADDRVDGRWIPRAWDQRHALTGGLSWRLGGGIDLGLAASWHSGWPTTDVRAISSTRPDGEVRYELVYGPRNGERLPSYLRLDMRATRTFSTRHGELRVFVEAINLTDRENVCCLDELEAVPSETGEAVVRSRTEHWAPIVPSLGLSWSF
jgi:hypothetical protein